MSIDDVVSRIVALVGEVRPGHNAGEEPRRAQ
jgi:hypothetical protein